MKTKVKITIAIAFILIFSVCYFIATSFDFTINKKFRNAVSGCDKIVIRNGEWDPNTAGKEILRVITDPCEVERFIGAIRFNMLQGRGTCGCPGDLTLEFFRNNIVILTATTPHNYGFRSRLTDYDVRFTKDTIKFFQLLMNKLPSNASGLNFNEQSKSEK